MEKNTNANTNAQKGINPRDCSVLHTQLDLLPVSATWVIMADDLENRVKDIAVSELGNDVAYVTLETNQRASSSPTIIMWLKPNSYHLVEVCKDDGDSVLRANSKRYSTELINFANKYASERDDRGNFIKGAKRVQKIEAKNGMNFTGIILDLGRILMWLFDGDNRDYRRVNGQDAMCIDCRVSGVVKYVPNSGKSEIRAIEVTKSINNRANRNTRPVPAFRDNNRDNSSRDDDFDDDIGRTKSFKHYDTDGGDDIGRNTKGGKKFKHRDVNDD